MADRRRYLAGIGALVLGSAVLLGLLVVTFGQSPRALFTKRSEYPLIFDNAPGVAVGTPVRRSGVKIGEVTRVQLNPETGEVQVTIQVEPQFAPRDKEEPIIQQGFINGNTTIDFVPKMPPRSTAPPAASVPAPIPPARTDEEQEEPQQPPPAAPPQQPPPPAQPDLGQPLPPGTVIRAPRQAAPRDLLFQAQELLPSTQQSLADIRRSVQRFEQIAPVLEDAIREVAEVARTTREVIPELRRTNDTVNSLAQSARAAVPEFRQTNEEVRAAVRSYSQTGQRLDDLLRTNQDRINRSVANLDEALGRINRVLSDENQRNVNATLANARRASERLEGTISSFDDLAKDTRKTVNKLNDTLTQADPVLQDIRKASQRFADSTAQLQAVLTDAKTVSTALAERGPSILRGVDESTAQLNKLLMQLQGFVGGAAGGGGTVQKLLTDPELYNRLTDLALMATRLLPRIDRALQDVETFADKIARHPELLGVGGAIRPSAGLKESPFAPYQPSMQGSPSWPPHQ